MYKSLALCTGFCLRRLAGKQVIITHQINRYIVQKINKSKFQLQEIILFEYFAEIFFTLEVRLSKNDDQIIISIAIIRSISISFKKLDKNLLSHKIWDAINVSVYWETSIAALL